MSLQEMWSRFKQKKVDRKDVIIAILVCCILAMLFFAWYYFREKKNPFAAEVMNTQAAYKYLFSIYEPQQLKRPLGVAVTDQGEVLVTDSVKHRLVVFDRNGRFLKVLGKAGKGPGEFNYPASIAVSGQKLYVADLYNQRVQVLNTAGEQISTIPSARDRRKFSSAIMPTTVAVDQQGNVYVSDIGAQRILVFDSSGNFSREFGRAGSKPGELSYVNGITVDDADGLIYLANSNNSRLEVYSTAGKYLKTIAAGKVTNPRGLAYNPDNKRVYAADTLAHKIVGVNAQGNVLETFGSRGVEAGSFNFPNALTFDEAGRLYIADRENNRVQVYARTK